MRFFLDTEFIEDGETITLVSLALVSEDNASLYAEIKDVDLDRGDKFFQNFVRPRLIQRDDVMRSRDDVRRDIVDFCGEDPEFWAWYSSYDWVAICQLFGRMVDIPSHWPKRCNDVKQFADDVGLSPRSQPVDEHNALSDAKWCRSVYKWLTRIDDRKQD